MLTLEQIKNLQKGDKITYHYKASLCDIDSQNWIYLTSETGEVFLHSSRELVNMSLDGTATETSPPKYDPTRPFKKGDIVQRRTVDGRTDPDVTEAINLTVKTDENKYGNVRVQEPNGRSIVTKSVFLELVTPVEEMRPYMVETDFVDDEPCWNIYKDGDLIVGYTSCHPNAKGAAEAECARLNEAHRKEQHHD